MSPTPGYVFSAAGIPRGAVITTLDSKKTDNIDEFEAALANLGDGDRGVVRFFTIDDPNGSNCAPSAWIASGSRRITARAMTRSGPVALPGPCGGP